MGYLIYIRTLPVATAPGIDRCAEGQPLATEHLWRCRGRVAMRKREPGVPRWKRYRGGHGGNSHFRLLLYGSRGAGENLRDRFSNVKPIEFEMPWHPVQSQRAVLDACATRAGSLLFCARFGERMDTMDTDPLTSPGRRGCEAALAGLPARVLSAPHRLHTAQGRPQL